MTADAIDGVLYGRCGCGGAITIRDFIPVLWPGIWPPVAVLPRAVCSWDNRHALGGRFVRRLS